MANTYTVSPNIIPGNVTIGGNLTVVGPQLRLGAGPPYMRFVTSLGTGGFVGVNIQPDGLTRDDTTKIGLMQVYNYATGSCAVNQIDALGNTIAAEFRRVFWTDHTIHSFTGVTGIQTVSTKTIYGNQMQLCGGILLRIMGMANASVAGNAQVGINWGGQAINLLGPTPVGQVGYSADVQIVNSANPASQLILARGFFTGGAIAQSATAGSKDTTLNQSLSVTVTPADAATTISVQLIQAEFFARASFL